MFSWLSRISWKKWAIVVVVILVAGFLIWRQITADNQNGYVFDTAQRRSITEIVAESGVVTTNGRVNIYSPTTGIVDQVFVSNGETVAEKQKLFTVKSTATPQEKAAALATYQAARAAVQQAENTRRSTAATVDRVHDDLKDKDDTENFLEKETRTAAEVANDNAYDSLLAAQAQLASAQVAYQATQNAVVTAPVAGLVMNMSATDGSNVSANNPLAPTSPILIIGGLGTTEVTISVGESDINKIKFGQAAAVELDAIPGRIYEGTLTRFDENGTITQGVVKFNAFVEIAQPDDLLKPGMTADVEITTDQLTDVLSVPNSAVKPYQKGRAVRKLGADGELEFIPVKIGVRGKEYTQILEGLVESQQIVVSLTNEKVDRKNPFGF